MKNKGEFYFVRQRKENARSGKIWTSLLPQPFLHRQLLETKSFLLFRWHGASHTSVICHTSYAIRCTSYVQTTPCSTEFILEAVQITKPCYRLWQKSTTAFSLLALSFCGELSQMFKQYGRLYECHRTWRPWERNHVCTPSVSQF